MKLDDVDIHIDKILLDPNNYRFRDDSDYRSIPEDKFHIDANQNKSLAILRKDTFDLINSIKANGFLKVERVVVQKYPHSDGKFVVIEGNRRIASLKQISAEINSEIYENDELKELLKAVPCLLAAEDQDLPAFKESLMGIRHVGGIKQWGGFQRAQLIAELRNNFGFDPQTVAERLGLSVREVNRRYRAISALNQMLDDEEFGDKATPGMYPIFHEAVALPNVRDWLSWEDETQTFTDNLAREQFYQLLIDTEGDEGEKQPAKILTYQDVRQLREILPHAQAKAYLLDPAMPFQASITAANQAEIQKKWREEVRQALSALNSITLAELRNFTENDVTLLKEIIDVAQKTGDDAKILLKK